MSGEKSRFLCVHAGSLWAQIGGRLCVSKDQGESWSAYPLSLPREAYACPSLYARIRRREIHCAKPLKGSKLLLVANRTIYLYDSKDNTLIRSLRIERGSRPLFICQTAAGALFWGEYFDNPRREEVNVFVSRDQARSWQVAYRFEKDRIRHIHGVFCDPHDGRLWVTTGDEDSESALWVTANEFKTVEKVIGGKQQSRALQLLFTKDHVYFGTDTPFEKNYICRLSKGAGTVERLAQVESSVYWGCQVGEALFFSTALEASTINSGDRVSIWGSRDGIHWRQFVKHKKDLWPAKLFQLGQIYFPQGDNTTDYLYYTPIATQDGYTLQRLRIADMFGPEDA